METTIDAIAVTHTNRKGQCLTIYKVEGTDIFCIGNANPEDHFEFTAEEGTQIMDWIETVMSPVSKWEK